jgi:hypothetical protein
MRRAPMIACREGDATAEVSNATEYMSFNTIREFSAVLMITIEVAGKFEARWCPDTVKQLTVHSNILEVYIK